MLSCDTKTLKDAFLKAARYSASKSTLPVLGFVRIITDDAGNAQLQATDLEHGIAINLPKLITSNCDACFPADTTAALLSVWGPTVKVEVNQKTMSAHFTGSNGAKTTLKLIDGMEFPPMECELTGSSQPRVAVKVEGKKFAATVNHIARCASTDDARPILTAVNMVITPEGKMTLTSADGFRLATETISPVEIMEKIDNKIEMNIPAKTMLDIAGMAEESITILAYKSIGAVSFRVNENTEVRSALIEGNFPGYEQIIPRKDGDMVLTMSGQTLLNAINRAGKIIKHDLMRVYVAPSQPSVDGYVRLTINEEETGDFEETMEADVEEPRTAPHMFGVNRRFFQELMISNGQVRISNAASNLPIKVTCLEFPGYIGVVMPMHIG